MWYLIVSIPDLCPLSYFQTILLNLYNLHRILALICPFAEEFLNQKCSICILQSILKLAIMTESKYLGLTISSGLSWSRHADNVTKKANSTMGILKRNIRYAPQITKETAYKTFVRPIVEYAVTTLASFTDTDTHKDEKVQRRAARFVSNDYQRTSSVTEMISNLCWDTLQRSSYTQHDVHHFAPPS